MKGMQHVIAIRQRGAKPVGVIVQLVTAAAAHPFGIDWLDFDPQRVVVEVLPGERIGDLDLRPLTGLFVTVEDLCDNPRRHRKLAAAVAAVNPETLVMPCHGSDAITLHIRRRGITETHVL